MGGFGVTVGQDQWDPKSGVDGTPNGGHWGHYGMGAQMWDRWETKGGVDGTLNGGHWGHCGMGRMDPKCGTDGTSNDGWEPKSGTLGSLWDGRFGSPWDGIFGIPMGWDRTPKLGHWGPHGMKH